jgi:protein gp37
MADVFEGPETMPIGSVGQVEIARERLSHLIERTSHLDWLLLTKRPQHVRKLSPPWWNQEGWPANVWLGTSVEDQQTADERIPHLLEVPAKVRFLSCEPLMGLVDLNRWLNPLHKWPANFGVAPSAGWHPGIHWVIVGGESGNKRDIRPMHLQWAQSIRDQCQSAGVPFLFKQWGSWVPLAQDFETDNIIELAKVKDNVWQWGNHGFPEPSLSIRVGKKVAGRLLDGREWNEFPASQ